MAQDEVTKTKTGPIPERVKTDKPWEDAVSDALKKKRPEGGWPKPEEDKKADGTDNSEKHPSNPV